MDSQLDLFAKGSVTDAAGVPGPLRADSPAGWGEFDLGWHDVSDFLGLSVGSRSLLGTKDAVGLALMIMCADVKARDISKAEMLLWRRKGRSWTLVEADKHPVAELLMTRPNDVMSWPQFWRMVVLHLELAQNAYVLKRIATDGTVIELIPIQPARCRARVNPNSGAVFYEIFTGTAYEQAVLGTSYQIVPADQMIHLRGRMWDGLYGLSNFALGSPIIDLVSAIAEFQRNIFRSDGKQPLVFETDTAFPVGDAGDAAFQRLKRQLATATRKAGQTGEPILLEAGLKAKVIALNSKDAESKDSFNQQIMRVCGLMNTPPHKVFALEAVAYNNMAAMNRQYYSDVLHPLAHEIQESFKLSLFERKEWPIFGPQFDQMSLMATDLDALKGLVDMAAKNGLMTFDEGREVLPFRLNPLAKGGDRRMVPVNMSLIGADGEIVHAGTGQNPTNPGAGESQSPDNNAGKTLRLVADNP